MGRQTQLHMLPEDCRQFVSFIRERDPVVATTWNSAETAEVEDIREPWVQGGHYCLWNQSLLHGLKREATGKYFNIDFAAPVIEFSYGSRLVEPWEGQAALLQGRIWASFETENKEFKRWYNAVVRWIRKNFVRERGIGLEGFVGPSAYEWFKGGGLLLPCFRPPLTEAWHGWADVQNQYRVHLVRERHREQG